MKKYLLLPLLPFIIFFASCKNNDSNPSPKYDSGEANFACYIAVGNSLTAGYSNNSLYRSGQENSYPAIMAKSFAQAGGGSFVQPLLPGEAGWPDRKLSLGQITDCTDSVYSGPVTYSGPDDTQGSTNNIANEGPFNNLGIPGVKVIDYTAAGYAILNYYAKRMFAQPDKPLMELIPQQRATFFSMWLGSNDVLGYALSGGIGSASGVGINDISPLVSFTNIYDTLVNRLTANGAKGILITIPDITQIPFFTTLNPKGLQLSASQASQLNQYYQGTSISFAAGKNYYVIADSSAPTGKRQMKPGEYLLLTTPIDSLICGTWGKTKPIPNDYVLTESEISHIQQATQAFNQVITSAAQTHHLAIMDATAYLQQINAGITEDGIHFDGKYISGGMFSLDGIHLTQRGYALLANQLLQTINTFYHSHLPMARVSNYKGVE